MRYRSLTKNKGKTSSKVEPDTQTLQLNTLVDVQEFLLFEDEMAQESNDDVLEAGEDMDEDTQADEEEHQSPPNIDKPEPSPAQETQESNSDSSSLNLKKYDNILPLTKRQLVKYLRKVSRVLFNRLTEDQQEKHKEAAVSYADLNASIKGYYEEDADHQELTDTLEAVKEDLVLNKKVLALKSLVKTMKAALDAQNDHLETWAKSSTSMAWNLGPSLTTIESSQAEIRSEISSLKSDTSEIKSMMTEIYQAFKGQSSTPSISVPYTTLVITKGPTHDDTKKPESNKAKEEPTNAFPISTVKPTKKPITTIISISQPDSSQALKRTDKGKKIATNDVESLMYHLTNDEINEHLEKEDKIKKVAAEAKRLEMTKTEVIKIVQEEAEKIGIDPKKIISAKAGEKFKKAKDAEMHVHKRQHTEKTKRLMELNKKRAEQYKNNDKRNFDVHNPFKFTDFGLAELDELGPIIQMKKNTIVKDLMTSLGKRYEKLKKILEDHGIQSALPAPIPEQDQS
ncbi:hypothetical protein Tco_1569186 [Tanacetum coccineum]